MRGRDFNKVVDRAIDRIKKTLASKGEEYSSSNDRLANFKMPCSIMDMNPAEVCLAYDMKHIASLSKIAKDASKGVFPSDEMLAEKVQDYINYGILFEAIITEMKKGE